MRWAWLTFICVVILAAFFMRPAHAQPTCFPNIDVARKLAESHNERFLFSAVARIGALIYVFGNEDTFTVFVQNPDGTVCTGPALFGEVIDRAKATCA